MPDLSPTVIDPELTQRLGQIVIRWTSLEGWISALLAHMVQADPGGMMLAVNNVAVSTQMKWIRGLMSVRSHEAEDNARIQKLLERAEDIRSERNELVHGIWDATNCEPGTAMVHTMSLDRPEIIRDRLVTLHDLDQLVIEIDDWIADYIKLGRELGFPRVRGGEKSIFTD